MSIDKIEKIEESGNISLKSSKSLNSQPLLNDTTTNNNQEDQNIKSIYKNEVNPNFGHVLLKCKNCEGYNKWIKENESIPMLGHISTLPNNVPQDVKSLYDQAYSYYLTDPQKSAQVLQQALDKLLEYYNEKNKGLNNTILNLSNKNAGKYNEVIQEINKLKNSSYNTNGISDNDFRNMTKNLFDVFNTIVRLDSANLN